MTKEQQWHAENPIRYFIGLDLGQSKDYTALSILRRRGLVKDCSFELGHLYRFPIGTSYPAIVDDVCKTLTRSRLIGDNVAKWLCIDATGVGAPVVDMIRKAKPAAHLRPILITGGDSVHRGAVTRVPKRELVSAVQVALQNRRLKVPEGITLGETLARELQTFQVKISLDTAHDSYGAWRDGQHDDLVLSVAMALWVGMYDAREISFAALSLR
jgi:hypothetical protein